MNQSNLFVRFSSLSVLSEMDQPSPLVCFKCVISLIYNGAARTNRANQQVSNRFHSWWIDQIYFRATSQRAISFICNGSTKSILFLQVWSVSFVMEHLKMCVMIPKLSILLIFFECDQSHSCAANLWPVSCVRFKCVISLICALQMCDKSHLCASSVWSVSFVCTKCASSLICAKCFRRIYERFRCVLSLICVRHGCE